MHRHANALTHALASVPAMWAAIGLTGYWIYLDPKTWYDALLAGGAMVLAQAIVRAGEPREKAIHKKLDEIIRVTDEADDKLQHIEEEE